jgi:hypothetical protein
LADSTGFFAATLQHEEALTMKNFLLMILLAALPLLSHATDIRVDLGGTRIKSGHTTITFGERDRRGYYWDGREWRDPDYWNRHHGKDKRYYEQEKYHDSGHHCPPGQAKKGNC